MQFCEMKFDVKKGFLFFFCKVCFALFGCVSALCVFFYSAVAIATEPERDTKFFLVPPTVEELGAHLFPDTKPKRLTRGISFAEPQDSETRQKSVGLPILFHFGKTTIVEQSRPFLENVGKLMTSEEYADRVLIVEGHTDAVGSDEYNQRLSELRALAVKDYLVNQFGVDPLRLFPTGKGESLLYKPESPADGVNRRVEFLPYENG